MIDEENGNSQSVASEETDFNFFKKKKKDSKGQSSRANTPPFAKSEDNNVPRVDTIADIQDEREDYYRMNYPNRGVALIFNHVLFNNGYDQRSGSHKDVIRMTNTLDDLKYDVKHCIDYTHDEIVNELDRVAKVDHRDNASLVIVMMSHGDPDMLHAKDGSFEIREIWEPFVGHRCPTLVGKPKLFFIQACRGNRTDPGMPSRVEYDGVPVFRLQSGLHTDSHPMNATNNNYNLKFPSMADFLFMYSSQYDHFSFRHMEEGSWFIQSLCQELDRLKKKHDLMTILTFVNRHMSFKYQSHVPEAPDRHEKKQVGSIVSSLTRLLHFYK